MRTPRVAPRVLGLAAVTVMVASAACGGGGGRTHDDFLHEVGHICARANRRFADIEVIRPDAQGARRALTEIVGVGAAALLDLRRVRPVKHREPEVAAWLGALEQALDEVRYARTLLERGHVQRAVDAVGRADVLTARAHVLGRGLGVDRACRVPRLLPVRT